MNTKFENIIIGFGKGGKTLAGKLAGKGHQVALIEKSENMYGGTCINVACIPSKFLENAARKSHLIGGDFEAKKLYYQKVIQRKRELITKLREKNYKKLADNLNAEVITGEASFVDSHHIRVTLKNQEELILEGERFFIDTGARPFIPDITGLKESRYMYISETMMELEKLPKHLVILGAGYIGLEFASYYANFGSKVTILQSGSVFLPREDQEIAEQAQQSLEKRGIQIQKEAKLLKVVDGETEARLTIEQNGAEQILSADAILVATGRRPNVKKLNLEAAGVELTERNAIKVNSYLQTTQEHIWAMGDVVGGLQFTYISLDDSRIVVSQIMGEQSRTTENRGAVPYSVFLDPPLSRVGLTEKEAQEKGYHIEVARLAVQTIPKALLLERTDGLLKVVIDADTEKILGAHLFCEESHEIINLFKLAIDAGISYTILRDNIYTHPTMSEALNDLFSVLE